MNFKKLVIESGCRMVAENYTIGTWGNISCRDSETGLVYLTPSGMNYGSITEEDIVVARLDGTVAEGSRRPTIEMPLHLGVYRHRPRVNAVIHTHPVYSTVFSSIGEDIPLLLDEAAQVLGDVCRTAEYALPGSRELADNCVRALGEKSNSCLLKSHGAVCVGENMEQAFCVAAVLEATARIYQLIRAMGATFDPISPENIAQMQYYVENCYGQR